MVVLNDLALQANALHNLDTKTLSYIGNNSLDDNKPRILVSPGTGLGLAGVVGKSVVSTEAGHINITDKVLKPDLKKLLKVSSKKTLECQLMKIFYLEKGLSIFISSYPVIKLQIYPTKIYFKEEMMKIVLKLLTF